MKKGLSLAWIWILLASFWLALIPFSGAIFIDSPIEATGKAAQQPVAVGVEIVSGPVPQILIIEPVNGTYLKNTSLPLRFEAIYADSIWYNLDYGENITIFGNTTFNASQGPHTLFLFANNSDWTIVKNVSFAVNLTLLNIIYDEYKGITRGNSTDFIEYTFEQLQQLSGLVLENTTSGKIFINQVVNVTDDADPSDSIVDFDSATDIFPKTIFVNTTEMPNLNKSASLSFYNITFAYPKIMYKGVECPASICTDMTFIGGTLRFDVSELAGLFFIEAAVPPPVPPAPSAPAPPRKEFIVAPKEMRVELVQGETKREFLTISNTGGTSLDVKIKQENLGRFISFEENEFRLEKGETKVIEIEFKADEKEVPGVYVGLFSVEGDGIEKKVDVILEIESAELVFGIDLFVPEEYRVLRPGDEFFVEVKITSTGPAVEGEVDYVIKNLEDEIVFEFSEKKMIEDQSYNKTITLPYEIGAGTYLLYVMLSHEDKVAVAAAPLIIVEMPAPPVERLVRFLPLIIAAVFIALAAWLIARKKKRKLSLVEIAIGKKVR